MEVGDFIAFCGVLDDVIKSDESGKWLGTRRNRVLKSIFGSEDQFLVALWRNRDRKVRIAWIAGQKLPVIPSDRSFFLTLLAKIEKGALPWTETLKSDLKVRLSDPLAIVISSILCKISSRAILTSEKIF